MIFMLGMTVWALVMLIGQYRLSLIGIIAMLLFVLALILIVEAVRTLKTKPAAEPQPKQTPNPSADGPNVE